MIDPTRPSLSELEALLAESERQAAEGKTVPLEPVLDRIRASITRMEGRRRSEATAARRA